MKKEACLHTHEKHPVTRIKTTTPQRIADKMSNIIGSWTFILIFLGIIFLWVLLNIYIFISYEFSSVFDPYPFEFLNLVLSCLAAIQAPIILMSQNRQSERDRIRNEYDYAVNRKAEKEIEEVKTQLEKIENKLKRR